MNRNESLPNLPPGNSPPVEDDDYEFEELCDNCGYELIDCECDEDDEVFEDEDD